MVLRDGLIEREWHEFDTFCAVCGVPLHVPEVLELIERYKWLQDAVAIRAPEVEQDHITENRRYHGHGKPMQILPIKEVNFKFYKRYDTIPKDKEILHSAIHEDDNPWIGMHRKCLEMMQQLLNYRNNALHLFNNNVFIFSRSNSPIIDEIVPIYDEDLLTTPTNLGEMYEVYRYRIKAPGSRAAGLGEPWYCFLKLLDPHEYYYNHGGHNLIDCDVWEFGSPDVIRNIFTADSKMRKEYETAPSPIPDLLPQILAYLQPLPPTTPTTARALQSKLDQLPPELQNTIFENLHPFTRPPVRCSRHLTPSTWKSLLLYGRLFPWLWELPALAAELPSVDVSLNDRGNGNRAVNVKLDDDYDQSWDWELLVRQLAQPEVFEPGGVMESAPLALRNRRRIWRLLDEARRNDITWYLSTVVYPPFRG